MYRALKPIYFPAGLFTEYVKGKLVKVEYFNVQMRPVGDVLVKDMAEAKRVYGGSPVLEEVR